MLKGIDVSKWQPAGTVDFSPYDFVIIKATEGVKYTDPQCEPNYQKAKREGKLLGVYHFARPGYNDPISEADWFVHEIEGYVREAILILDWEVEATWNVEWAKKWLDRVYQLTGVKPMIYMSASVVNGNDWSPVVAGDYGLWIAGYPPAYNVPNPPLPTPDDMPYGIGAWPFWAIWQYSSSKGSLDRDISPMDADAWKKYAGASVEPTPEPQPTPTPEPTPEPSGDFKVGDKVVLKELVDYTGTPLIKVRDFYYISQIIGDRAVLNEDSVDGVVYAAVNTNNLELVSSGSDNDIQVGDKVALIAPIDYDGRSLIITRKFYYVNQINGDRVVLCADSVDGTVYAAVRMSNLIKL